MLPHERWLKKAAGDLKVAKKVVDDEETRDGAVYHVHECAEKALKAYLAYKKQPIKRTHDLEFLVKLCDELDEEFMDKIFEHARILDPYGSEFRYPSDDDLLVPDIHDAQRAIQFAEEILKFVIKKIEQTSK